MSYTRLASSNNWKPRRGEQLNPKSHCKTIERWVDNITGINIDTDKLITKLICKVSFTLKFLKEKLSREWKLSSHQLTLKQYTASQMDQKMILVAEQDTSSEDPT